MKKILYFLLSSILLFASQSKYPLDFSFEEKSLFPSYIAFMEDDCNNTVASIIFRNNQDNILILSNSIIEIPGCNIETLDQMENILNSNFPEPCKRAFKLHGRKYKKIQLKHFTINLYKNEESNFRTAFVFDKNKFVSTIFSDMHSDEFIEILLSLKKRKKKNSDDVNYYIDSYKKYLKRGEPNRSLKQLISAFILDPKNKILDDLYHKLIQKRIGRIKMFDNFRYRSKDCVKATNSNDSNARIDLAK